MSDQPLAGVAARSGGTAHRAARRPFAVLAALFVVLTAGLAAAPAASAAALTITGTVTGKNAAGAVVPLEGATVYALDADHDWKAASSSADGTYSIEVAAAGTYEIEARAPYVDGGEEEYAYSRGVVPDVTVADGTPATADVRLLRYTTVTGTVTLPDGQPAEGIRVEASPYAGGEVRSTTTDAAGAYTLTKVAPGRSSVNTSYQGSDRLYADAYWNGTESTPDYTSVDLPEGPDVVTAPLALTVQSGITGKAVDADGTPLQNIGWTVLTYNVETGAWDGPQMGPLLTDADGTMFWRTTPTGRYKLCFYDNWYYEWSPALRYADNCYGDTAGADAATEITTPASDPRVEATVTLDVAGQGLQASAPFVTGDAAVGGELTVHPGEWTAGTTLTYAWTHWSDEGVRTVVGTGPTFTPTAALDGEWIQIEVTGTKDGYATAMVQDSAGLVGAPSPTIASLAIGGTPAVGQTLTADIGAITPADAYPNTTWSVAGKTYYGDTLEVTADMVGHPVSLKVQVYGDSGQNSGRAYAETAAVTG